MVGFFYTLLSAASRIFGSWFFSFWSRCIAAGFFIAASKPRKASADLYSALYPSRSHLYHLYCTWKQFGNFTTVYLDRIVLQRPDMITYTSEGWDRLERAVQDRSGGIIVMSHMGNWELAAHLLHTNGLELLLYMGSKQKEQIERMQKDSLSEKGVKIVAVDKGGGSPFDILDGLSEIQNGRLVSMAGDIVWDSRQKTVSAEFLNREVRLSETPHLFALVSGAPLFYFFAFKTGRRSYHITIEGPFFLRKASRKERKVIIQESVQQYACILEEKLSRFPFQWYHFDSFLGSGKTRDD